LNPAGGALNLIFTDYAQPGDRMSLTFDGAARKITALNINTYMGAMKGRSDVADSDGSLPGGTNYAQQTFLTASAKQLVVTTTNSITRKSAGTKGGARAISEECKLQVESGAERLAAG